MLAQRLRATALQHGRKRCRCETPRRALSSAAAIGQQGTAQEVALRSRGAALQLATLPVETRNEALAAMLANLELRKPEIMAANELDMQDGDRLVAEGKESAALIKRLDLRGSKWDDLMGGVASLIPMADPIGAVSYATELDDGLELYRVSCPLGVIAVIFEARPDAAVQIASLALKSANAIILKGGSEATRSNAALVSAMREGIASVVPVDAINVLEGRAAVADLLEMDEHVDLIIPRGSNELVQSIQNSTRIPVLGHADGICAVYVDKSASVQTAVDVVVDAKTQYPAVCNATETLLVDAAGAAELLPAVAAALAAKGVTLHAAPCAMAVLGDDADGVVAAADGAFKTEWLSLDVSVKLVEGVGGAVEHINAHGSGHTDAIVTEDKAAAEHFLAHVDTANVFHNASTRFADGFRYGFGAEVGVSTNKTHARGPVGLEGLCIYKYKLLGRPTADGRTHTVGNFGEGDGKRKYLHRAIPSEAVNVTVE